MNMKCPGNIAVLLFFALMGRANPIAISPVTMTAENVLIGVSPKGVVVSGRYVFALTPYGGMAWGTEHFPLFIDLPVPVPEGWKDTSKLLGLIKPVVIVNGTRYTPHHDPWFDAPPKYLNNARLAVFHFSILRDEPAKEMQVEIQYDQPIVVVAGRDMVYYVPMLPTYEVYKTSMGLRPESYLITFESVAGSSLSLRTPVSHLRKDSQNLISVSPVNLEVIGIERVPNQSPDPTASTVTPAADAPVAPPPGGACR